MGSPAGVAHAVAAVVLGGVGEQPGVLLWVRGIPPIAIQVGDPQGIDLLAREAHDEVDARILVTDSVVELDQYRALGRVDRGLRRRVPAPIGISPGAAVCSIARRR
jgi:hypothetical protein